MKLDFKKKNPLAKLRQIWLYNNRYYYIVRVDNTYRAIDLLTGTSEYSHQVIGALTVIKGGYIDTLEV